ncbi:MAG: hypothetical protein K1Y36_11810 [Blastocatellia bacterium]|nr:hypothetical protein [Blastocatellia bacterium]
MSQNPHLPQPSSETPPMTVESGELRPPSQSLVEIERELNERLTALGLPVLAGSGNSPATRQTQHITPVVGQGSAATQVLDLRELRSALQQQIRVAEIKEQIVEVIHQWLHCQYRTDGLADPFEFELKAAALLIPYCREYIPDFPAEAHPAELAMDLDFQPILRAELMQNEDRQLNDEQIENCAVQIIQALLDHPLLPRNEADRIEVSLHTTTLRDKNGTSIYTPTDARFLKALIEEQRILSREGEIGLLAMLISGRKWSKIDSEPLFIAAIEYTLEALAKKRNIQPINIRNQGPDHPVAYILGEYIMHNISFSLEELVGFVEETLNVTRIVLEGEDELFTSNVRREYVPRLKKIFRDLIHDSIYRFLQVFDREFMESTRSDRSKMFLLKRVGDFCELTFYCYEAVWNLETRTGEVYARERLYEGTEHFARRNNIPLSEGMDFFNRKNTLAELFISALKYRREKFQRTQTGSLRLPDPKAQHEAWKQISGVLMSDLLFCLDQLRRTFDHDYARGRENTYSHYQSWKERVLVWSEAYSRLLYGRSLSDVDNYRITSLAAQLIEEHLAFVNLHLPTSYKEGGLDFGLENRPRTRQPEDILKENFICFIRSFHTQLVGQAQSEEEAQIHAFETFRSRPTTMLSPEDFQKRVFLARSDLPLSTYTMVVLTSFLAPETHDRAVLLQALETGLDLAQKAYIAEEVIAVRLFLKQLLQRLDLLVILTEVERGNFRDRLSASIKELDQREPVELTSYLFALKDLEDIQLSDERVLEEWKNTETSIRRLLQLQIVLTLSRSRAEIKDLVDTFSNWVSLNPQSQDLSRHNTLNSRLSELSRWARQGRLKHRLIRGFLRMARRTQVIAGVKDWYPPETYVLEDLLGLETTPRRIRELEAILAIYDEDELNQLMEKLGYTLAVRFQETGQTRAYYAPEERLVLTVRFERLQQLQNRTGFQRLRARIGQAFLVRLVRPFQKLLTAEE